MLHLSERELEVLDTALKLSRQDARAGEYLVDQRETVESVQEKTHTILGLYGMAGGGDDDE